MAKRITGSFIEFEHPNRAERVLTHDTQIGFSAAQWQTLVTDMAEMGMDTLILLSTALRGNAYFPFEGFPYPPHFACPDVMNALLSAADQTGQRVFLGVGFYGNADSVTHSTDPAVVSVALKAMETLYALYGHHACVEGWYIADEWCIWDHFDERFIEYINTVSAQSRRLDPKLKVMVAPFGTHCLQADDVFAEQLTRIDADIIAYQDEIGVKKMPLEKLAERFAALRAAHDKAGRSTLWVDTEIFDFAGDVYRSALIPASIERINAQLEAVSPFVDKIIAYTVQGIVSRPHSIASLGGNAAEALYRGLTTSH